MKAIGLMQYGDKSVLQEIEMKTPLLGDNNVLIEVYAAGINPWIVGYKRIEPSYYREAFWSSCNVC